MLRVILTTIIVYICCQYVITGNSVFTKKRSYLLYNLLTVFCFYSFFNMIVWCYELNFLITITFFYILMLSMYYVHEFRGTNLNYSDIRSINTAKEVAGGYKYEIKPMFVIVGLFIIAEYVLHIFVIKIDILKNYHKAINGIESINIDIYRFFWHEIGHVLAFFISFFILSDKISLCNYDYSLSAGENEGYLYNFFSSIPIFHKNKFDYAKTIFIAKQFIFNVLKSNAYASDKKVEMEIMQNQHKYKNYCNENQDAPHVIVIMNESFGSVHRRVKTNVQVTPYYDNLPGTIKGNLFVNTFGGGTANTEFEFLTGMTIGNYPYPVMPYNNFVKRNKYSLARYFSNLGYKTIAMHPYTATNYHRDKVYKYFGFEDLVFFNDFKNKVYTRKFINDECMYEEVIRRFRIVKAQQKKAFMFGITMQNHSGYGDLKGADVLAYINDCKNRAELDNYLSLMKMSDEAIHILIDYFRQEDEHTIILFFGDHNASFGTELNKQFYDGNMEYEGTNAYSTPFFIFDNRIPEERFIKNISANFLSLELLNKAGLPYDMIHHLLNDLYKKYSVYNYHKRKERLTGKFVDIDIDRFMMLEKEYLR